MGAKPKRKQKNSLMRRRSLFVMILKIIRIKIISTRNKRPSFFVQAAHDVVNPAKNIILNAANGYFSFKVNKRIVVRIKKANGISAY